MNHKRILVVDHSEVVLKAISLRLAAEGYEVLMAQDGAGAVSSARCNQPDLILLNINFPPDVANGGGVSWDGFLIQDWLRRMDEAKGIPVILMSEDDPQRHYQRAVASGAVGLFQKPVDLEELLGLIRQLVGETTLAECAA